MIEFNASREDRDLISKIADRVKPLVTDRLGFMMDLEACHCNGCPLDLKGLLDSDYNDLLHDCAGIADNLDRETGNLTGNFIPRFAKKPAVFPFSGSCQVIDAMFKAAPDRVIEIGKVFYPDVASLVDGEGKHLLVEQDNGSVYFAGWVVCLVDEDVFQLVYKFKDGCRIAIPLTGVEK